MREPLRLVEKICLALLGTLFIAALGFGGYFLHDTREQITELKIEIENTEEDLILITERQTRKLNEHAEQIDSNYWQIRACMSVIARLESGEAPPTTRAGEGYLFNC